MGLYEGHLKICRFFLDVLSNQDLVHTTVQQILLILTKNFYILENNLQFVIVKLSYGARLDGVVDK